MKYLKGLPGSKRNLVLSNFRQQPHTLAFLRYFVHYRNSGQHWSNYLEEMDFSITFVFILKNIMLGNSKGMLDPDGHEITFGTSANIFGWKKTFTA